MRQLPKQTSSPYKNLNVKNSRNNSKLQSSRSSIQPSQRTPKLIKDNLNSPGLGKAAPGYNFQEMVDNAIQLEKLHPNSLGRKGSKLKHSPRNAS